MKAIKTRAKKWKNAKPMGRCEQYARDVVSGKEVAGQYIIKAAKRFLKDLKRDDIYWDEVESMRIVKFIERYCRLFEAEWKGKPMQIMPWMAFILQQIYGWHRTVDKRRRIRKVFVEVAKKNAKSTLAGGINIFHLFADEKVNTPNIYVGANNYDQAAICTNITGKIIKESPELNELVQDGTVKMFKTKEKYTNIEHTERDGFIKTMTKEASGAESKTAGTKHGINPSLIIVDEYAMADSDSFINALESAVGARQEPLTVVITTAGHKQSGPCFQKLRKIGIEVLDGVIENDSYLPLIWEPDDNDNIYDPKTWKKSNPNLDVSVNREFLKNELREAKSQGGSKAVEVTTYNFNTWVDSPEVWIPTEVWKENTHGILEKELAGQLCYGGLEIVSGLDLNAFILFFPNFKGEINAVKCFFWMAEEKVIENKMKIDCSTWVDRGFIKTTSGNVIDNEEIFDWVINEIRKYNMHSLAFNIILQNHDVLQGLIKAGVECNPISQGYRGVSEPSYAWEELLTAEKIEHFKNPVLQWMNANCFIVRKENDIRVQRSNGRVAGISAAINALAQFKTIGASPQPTPLIESWN